MAQDFVSVPCCQQQLFAELSKIVLYMNIIMLWNMVATLKKIMLFSCGDFL